jgi:hypothetical protein
VEEHRATRLRWRWSSCYSCSPSRHVTGGLLNTHHALRHDGRGRERRKERRGVSRVSWRADTRSQRTDVNCKRVLAHPETLFDAGTSFWPNPV